MRSLLVLVAMTGTVAAYLHAKQSAPTVSKVQGGRLFRSSEVIYHEDPAPLYRRSSKRHATAQDAAPATAPKHLPPQSTIEYSAFLPDAFHVVHLNEHIRDPRTLTDVVLSCGVSTLVLVDDPCFDEWFPRTATVVTPTDAKGPSSRMTIVTTSVPFVCEHDGRVILRVLRHFSRSDGTLTLFTEPLRYQDVFQHANVTLVTNHTSHEAVTHRHPHRPGTASERDGSHSGHESTPASHSGHPAGFFKKAVKEVKKVVSAIESVVTKAANAVEDGVKLLTAVVKDIQLVLKGDFSTSRSFTLLKMTFGTKWDAERGGDGAPNDDASEASAVTAALGDWVVGNGRSAANYGCGVELGATLHFSLDIKKFELQTAEVSLRGSLYAGVQGRFLRHDTLLMSDDFPIATFHLRPIFFMIGPIPVLIRPTLFVNGGYVVTADGFAGLNFVWSAEGSIRQGFSYSAGSGLAMIREHDFKYQRDFSQRRYINEIAATLWISTILDINVDFIGGPRVALTLRAEALLGRRPGCREAQLVINVQPVITASAYLDVNLGPLSVFHKELSPVTLYANKFNIYTYCIGSGEGEAPVPNVLDLIPNAPVNLRPPVTQPPIALNLTGLTFVGSCRTSVAATIVSLQFLSPAIILITAANGAGIRQAPYTKDVVAPLDSNVWQFLRTIAGSPNASETSIIPSYVGAEANRTVEDLPLTVDVTLNSLFNSTVDIRPLESGAMSLLCPVTLSTFPGSDDNTTFTTLYSDFQKQAQCLDCAVSGESFYNLVGISCDEFVLSMATAAGVPGDMIFQESCQKVDAEFSVISWRGLECNTSLAEQLRTWLRNAISRNSTLAKVSLNASNAPQLSPPPLSVPATLPPFDFAYSFTTGNWSFNTRDIVDVAPGRPQFSPLPVDPSVCILNTEDSLGFYRANSDCAKVALPFDVVAVASSPSTAPLSAPLTVCSRFFVPGYPMLQPPPAAYDIWCLEGGSAKLMCLSVDLAAMAVGVNTGQAVKGSSLRVRRTTWHTACALFSLAGTVMLFVDGGAATTSLRSVPTLNGATKLSLGPHPISDLWISRSGFVRNDDIALFLSNFPAQRRDIVAKMDVLFRFDAKMPLLNQLNPFESGLVSVGPQPIGNCLADNRGDGRWSLIPSSDCQFHAPSVSLPPGNTSFTTCLWVYPQPGGQQYQAMYDFRHATEGTGSVVEQSVDGAGWFAAFAPTPHAWTNPNGAAIRAVLPQDQWSFFCVTKSDRTISYYANGTLRQRDNFSTTATMTSNNGGLYVGCVHNSNPNCFSGAIHALYVSLRVAYTDGEIWQLYQSEMGNASSPATTIATAEVNDVAQGGGGAVIVDKVSKRERMPFPLLGDTMFMIVVGIPLPGDDANSTIVNIETIRASLASACQISHVFIRTNQSSVSTTYCRYAFRVASRTAKSGAEVERCLRTKLAAKNIPGVSLLSWMSSGSTTAEGGTVPPTVAASLPGNSSAASGAAPPSTSQSSNTPSPSPRSADAAATNVNEAKSNKSDGCHDADTVVYLHDATVNSGWRQVRMRELVAGDVVLDRVVFNAGLKQLFNTTVRAVVLHRHIDASFVDITVCSLACGNRCVVLRQTPLHRTLVVGHVNEVHRQENVETDDVTTQDLLRMSPSQRAQLRFLFSLATGRMGGDGIEQDWTTCDDGRVLDVVPHNGPAADAAYLVTDSDTILVANPRDAAPRHREKSTAVTTASTIVRVRPRPLTYLARTFGINVQGAVSLACWGMHLVTSLLQG